MLSPETTASGGSGSRWERAMFTQSDGVPATVRHLKPPTSASPTATAAWRLYARPIQLCSRAGTTISMSATPVSAAANAGRNGESIPSSLDSSRRIF